MAPPSNASLGRDGSPSGLRTGNADPGYTMGAHAAQWRKSDARDHRLCDPTDPKRPASPDPQTETGLVVSRAGGGRGASLLVNKGLLEEVVKCGHSGDGCVTPRIR